MEKVQVPQENEQEPQMKVIGVGSVVKLHFSDEAPDDAESYTIGIDHVVGDRYSLSLQSALGSKLLGKTIGQTVSLENEDGDTLEVVIVDFY